MNPSADPARWAVDSPTIAEVTALTRRLRELSAPGRAADPAERAAFLADKDALLARITAAHRDAGGEPTGAAGAMEDAGVGELHSHRVPAERIAPVPADQAGSAARDDSDGWFSGGYDAAHDAYLDALVHADVPGPATGWSPPAGEPSAIEQARGAVYGARLASARAAADVEPAPPRWDVDEADAGTEAGTDAGTEAVADTDDAGRGWG
ncbi:hypothetical protein [Pseudonocardia nigra]|uniref:hypothetical protein n=1 Tax=Pseudonocardia nigra TaxID=1921578 RepID=UPI001C60750C|nr:hypothetical protein [Pseudonocardia nigra]